MGKQFMIPSDPVDIYFHDAQIRHCCTKVRIHHRAKMTVKIMASNVHLMGISNCCDLHRLPNTVPRRIDNRYVDCLAPKKGQELLDTDECFTRGNGMWTMRANEGQCIGITAIDLDPK